VSSCFANSASFTGGFSSLFSMFCESFWGGRLTIAVMATSFEMLFKLNDLRGGIGGASSKELLAITLVLAMALLFDICSTSINGPLQLDVMAVAVSEDVLDDEELIEDDEDSAKGVECVALTTIVFGAFPFITFTLTTFTTVVLFKEVDGTGCCFEATESERISFCCSAVLLIMFDGVVVADVVGMIFLANLGEV
jgi:hypothetical protein